VLLDVAFKKYLSCTFDSLTKRQLGKALFCLNLLGVLWAFWTWMSVSFPRFGRFQQLFNRISMSFSFSSPAHKFCLLFDLFLHWASHYIIYWNLSPSIPVWLFLWSLSLLNFSFTPWNVFLFLLGSLSLFSFISLSYFQNIILNFFLGN
jgi:hypothetical protein